MVRDRMKLEDVRESIDAVDQKIRSLFIERMKLAGEVARIKAETGDSIYKPDREKQIIKQQSRDMDPDLLMEYRALLRRIMEISRKYQYGRTLELRECYPFHPEDAAPEISRMAMTGKEMHLCPFCPGGQVITAADYGQMGEWIRSGYVDAGAGVIGEVGRGASDELNSMLLRHELYINDCIVSGEDGIKRKIVLFTKHLTALPEHNRVKTAFVCPNRSGALAGILSMIADYGVNVTEIHSIPFRPENGSWNYTFFAELEMNMLEKESKALLFQLSQETEMFRLLGSYFCEGDF